MEERNGQRPDETQSGTQKAQEAESGNRARELRILKAANANQDCAVCEARKVKFLRRTEVGSWTFEQIPPSRSCDRVCSNWRESYRRNDSTSPGCALARRQVISPNPAARVASDRGPVFLETLATARRGFLAALFRSEVAHNRPASGKRAARNYPICLGHLEMLALQLERVLIARGADDHPIAIEAAAQELISGAP
jgi:hypothetical protein